MTTIVENRETSTRENIYKCGGKSSDLSVMEVDDLVTGGRGLLVHVAFLEHEVFPLFHPPVVVVVYATNAQHFQCNKCAVVVNPFHYFVCANL